MSAATTMRALLLSKSAGVAAPKLSFAAAHPVPVPQPGQLLVRIHASAIHPSDRLNVSGGFPYTTYPRIPGRDFSGVVVSEPTSSGGDNQSRWQGKAVFGTSGADHSFSVDGFQAEYAVVASNSVVEKPEALSHVQAATVGVPFTTAALTVKRSLAKAGDVVLVLGARGNVGKWACVLLEEMGCRVLRAVRGPGGDVDTQSDPELATVRRSSALAPKGVDVVIDTVGAAAMTRAAIDDALGQGGRLVFIAAPRGPGPAASDLAFNMLEFYRTEKTLMGVNSLSHSGEEMAGLLGGLHAVLVGKRWAGMFSDEKWTEVAIEDALKVYEGNTKDKYVVTIN